jgi:hypothetical protein
VILTDLAAYRAHPGISFSKDKVFDQNPYLYFKRYVERSIPEDNEDTKAMRLGTAAHCLLLEGYAEFDKRYTVKPATYTNDKGEDKPWNANAALCKAMEERWESSGLTVLTRDEDALLRRLLLALHTNSDAADLLKGGTAELGIIRPAPALGMELKGRLDYWNAEAGVVVDLKTIECLDDLPREIERRLYYRQAAWYRHLAAEEFGSADVRFAIIGVEKQQPHRCGVYYLRPDLLSIGDAENFASLTNLAMAHASGQWGGNPKTVEVGPSLELKLRHLEPSEA